MYLKPCIILDDRIRCEMVHKIGFTNWNAKIALLRASMIVTYQIKLFQTGANRHEGISRKFYIRRNNNKVDSIETGRIVIAHLLP